MNDNGGNGAVRIGVAALLAVALVVSAVAMPVSAAGYDEFQEPELTTSVQGSNVVVPGETTTLQVGIQNRGTAVTKGQGRIDRLAQAFQSAGVKPGAAMAIDPAARVSLEVERTMAGTRKGSLVDAVDRTVDSLFTPIQKDHRSDQDQQEREASVRRAGQIEECRRIAHLRHHSDAPDTLLYHTTPSGQSRGKPGD